MALFSGKQSDFSQTICFRHVMLAMYFTRKSVKNKWEINLWRIQKFQQDCLSDIPVLDIASGRRMVVL